MLVGLVVISALGYVAVHLRHVHDESWEYRWTPSAAPPRITFEGRHYLRGDVERSMPAGEIPLGRTPGGGVINGAAGLHEYSLTVVEVVASGQITVYALSGGP